MAAEKSLYDMDFAQLRARAKELKINSFSLGRGDLIRAIEDATGVKRGRPRWKPASLLDVVKKTPGYRYRWVENTPENIAKKRRERWEMAPKEDSAQHVQPGHVQDGQPLTTVTEMREMVLMRMPEEDARERDAYIRELTRQQTVGIKKDVEDEIARAADSVGARRAAVHGKIIIE